MATSKQSFARAGEPQCSVSAQRKEEMHVKAPLTTMYVHNGSAPGLQPYPQAQPGALQDATVVPVFLPGMCSNQTLSALTLHIASSSPLQQQRLSAPATSSRPKSTGKHVCTHCGKDCLKPSVLEKHLRCHTGERPYPCTTCGISFKTQSNLYKHKRTQAHARLSNESDKGIFSSQESLDVLKDSELSSKMHSEDSADMKTSGDICPAASVTTECPADGKTQSMDGFSTTPQKKVNFLSTTVQLSPGVEDSFARENTSPSRTNGRGPLTSNRTPLQRQEALFSKPWDSLMSRGKSQSHDSTDSGFSDSCEHHSSSSPGSSLHNPSIESMPESIMEHQELEASQSSSKMTPDDPKSKVSVQEKQKLEERISKLIYENSVLVEDKQLDNVRPRKTVLSKQGSIDLPVPYTYKDSFHFEIRSSKHTASAQKQDRGGGAIYRSVPTQQSISPEHAPLIRSSSLPFTVSGKHNDGAINTNLSRRCSAGHVYPSISKDQRIPFHRSLVRQVAVDCQPTSDVSPGDRASISSLSSDGDSTDIAKEPSMKGNYRKKTRKFDYTKWHTYKGGTFRKLYNAERDCPLRNKKTHPCIEQTENRDIQICQTRDNASMSLNFNSCSVVCLSKTADVMLAQTQNQATSSYILLKSSPLDKKEESFTLENDTKYSNTDIEKHVKSADVEGEKFKLQGTDCPIPSERKKQRTDVHMLSMSRPRRGQVNANLCGLISQPPLPTCAMHATIAVPPQNVNVPSLHEQSNFRQQFSNPSQVLCRTPNPSFCLINMIGTSGSPSVFYETKTSFPPKYQLKIPSYTDGVPHNTSQALPALNQNQCYPENSLPSTKPCQAAQEVTPSDQSKQGAVSETSSLHVLSVSSSGQNMLSKVLTQIQPTTLTSFVSIPPVQHQTSFFQGNSTRDGMENLSTGPVSFSEPLGTTEDMKSCVLPNTASTISGSADSIERMYSSETTVQNQPEFTCEKPPGFTEDMQSSVFEDTLNSTGSNFHGSLSEAKVVQAANTFYVRTADLQIVMQIISDEQLALIEPHIERPEFKPAESYPPNPLSSQISILQDQCRDNGTNLCGTQDMVTMSQNSESITSKHCESANSENKTLSSGGLHLHNAENDAGAHSRPTCVSSWSHSQTKFHISASVDNKMIPAGRFYDSHHEISNNLQQSVGFDSGDKLSFLVDTGFSMKEEDKELKSLGPEDTLIQDQTCTDKKLNIETDPKEPDKTRHIMPLRGKEGVQIMKPAQFGSHFADKTIKIPAATESQQMEKALVSTIQPCQTKSCWTTCPDEREMKESELKLGAQGNETSTHDIQQGFGNNTDTFEAHNVMPNKTSNWVPGDSSECEDVSLDTFTGSREYGALRSDAGTESKESIRRKPEGADKETSVTIISDTNNICQSCENDDTLDKIEKESCQTAVQAHGRLSQEVINASLNVSNPTQHDKLNVPHNPAPSVCNILSQTCQPQGQEDCKNYTGRDNRDGDTSQEISQRETASPGYEIASCSPGLDVAGFANQASTLPLVCPLLVNANQKETPTRNVMTHWACAKGTETHVISPQNKSNSPSVLHSHFRASISSSCAGSMSSNAPPKTYNQISSTNQKPSLVTVGNSQTDSKLLYSASNSYLEHEDSNSSSDDEQKLVIELE